MKITVYTTPGCSQCNLTKKWLTTRSIPFDVVDLSESPADMAAVKALGYAAAPVIIVSNGDAETDIHWYGFNPANLARYTAPAVAA